MANIEKFPLEARGETVSREALVQAALHEITQNYREASLEHPADHYLRRLREHQLLLPPFP